MGYIVPLLIYILGGLTFLPLVLSLILLHAHLFFPHHPATSQEADSVSDPIRDPNDDGHNIKSDKALANIPDQFQRSHEPDVAAGYFAVCREYVPGGINGKPPERITPAGAVVAMESLSVYQTMYRSIFDRRQSPSLEPGRGNGRAVKRARNVFFVVLRHGHLMLYDDSEQAEVRYVISLEHHHVSIYGEEAIIPEGELWIKRNAICLARKADADESAASSKPFFLFSENCSEKEDFYFALLQNQEVKPQGRDNPPRPQLYEVKHVIGLVQKLHSSEEHLQTRWINALVGRAFLALYKTKEVEDFVRKKISKKIARVRKPAFLSNIVLQKIDMGESAPSIINPRLKDLTIDGECCVEADVKYTGNFRLELATIARIDLGTRFKAREVNLVLAVVVKSLEGHLLARFKPPPSNRLWIAFDKMPEMEMSIEPIVSSRQITYNIILRAIESRIREVVAETMVLPHWDDIPFMDTEHQEFRGGIWAVAKDLAENTKKISIPVEEPEEEESRDGKATPIPASPTTKDTKSMSELSLAEATSPDSTSITSAHPPKASSDGMNHGTSTGAERGEKPPMAMRSRSFAAAANPLVNLDSVNIDAVKNNKPSQQRQDASSAMMALSNRSQPMSPTETAFGMLKDSPTLWETSKAVNTSTFSKPKNGTEKSISPAFSEKQDPVPAKSTRARSHSLKVRKGNSEHHEEHVPQGADSTFSLEKGQSMATLGAAAAAAKKWGWSVLNRNNMSNEKISLDRPGTPEHPIGRGRPLPPPGQPLPFPERSSLKALHGGTIRKKSINSPVFPQGRPDETKTRTVSQSPPSGRKSPPFRPHSIVEDGGLMVVEAPLDSEPDSPSDNSSKGSTGSSRPISTDSGLQQSSNQEDTGTVIEKTATAEASDLRLESSSHKTDEILSTNGQSANIQ